VGFSSSFHDYLRERRDNRAPTTARRLVMRAVDALTTFSITPIVFLLGLAAAVWIVPVALASLLVAQAAVSGRAPSLAALAVLAAAVAWCVTLSALAIVAHYVGRIFVEVKHRPRYIIRDVVDKVGAIQDQ